LGICGREPFSEIAAPAKQCSPHHWQSSKIPCVYDYITNLSRQHAEVIQNYDNKNVRNIGQGEARHRECMVLKFGGGQT
jgi:hypothetical protein